MAEHQALRLLACIVIGYFIGCISPSFLVCKRRGYDVRETGSKNAGASNTIIMAGPAAGVLVALLDIFKAALAWKLAEALFPMLPVAGMLSGAACVLGHMFPVFLGFRGGKGLACLGGLALACSPKTLLIMVLIAAAIALLSNYICVVTVSMSLIFPLYFGLTTGFWLGALIIALPAPLIFYKHLVNFRRIAAGKEVRLSYLWKKDKELDRTGNVAADDDGGC